jgi:hypothetical protein
MIVFVVDILTLLLGPRTWRGLSAPTAVAGASFLGLMGAFLATLGVATWMAALTTQDRLVATGELVLGLLVLGDVGVGVIAFLRHNRERA